MRFRRRLQCAAACVAIAAYAGLSHYCNSVPAARGMGAVLALAPVTVITVILLWRSLPARLAAPLCLGIAGLLVWLWPRLEQNYSLFYLVQESGVYGLLALSFARSLLSNRIALCTRLADQVHGPLSPREIRYTRQVTAAWALFFLAVSATSVLLFVLAPLRVWSIYINFCVLPLVAAMFIAEYLVRRRVLPQVTGAGLLATVRVYLAAPQ
jgi:uncharacterized membrane protein